MIEQIVDIVELDINESMDIELTGDHLFFANDILTHNSSSDPGLEDTSESFGLPATADLMFAMVSNDELHKMNQIMIKQLKNRYSDPNINKKFVIGVDRTKMRLYDTEENAQIDITKEDVQSSQPKNKFSGLKM